jgi:hypothetical protein
MACSFTAYALGRLMGHGRSILGTGLVVIVLAGAMPGQASAATVVSPPNGGTVASLPTCVLDFAGASSASVTIELSKYPDLITSGEQAGRFVDRSYSASFLYDPTATNATTSRDGRFLWPGWEGRIPAGPYYWHAEVSTFGTGTTDTTFTSVLRVVVADEPIIINAWTLRAHRALPDIVCTAPVDLSGKILFEDNSKDQRASWTMKVDPLSRTAGTLVGIASGGSTDIDERVCTRARRLTVHLPFKDSGGNITTSPETKVVPLPPAPRVKHRRKSVSAGGRAGLCTRPARGAKRPPDDAQRFRPAYPAPNA